MKVRRRGLVDARELEAMVAEDPLDESRWDVLEDFLVDRGDPRAGIVAAQQTGDSIELAKAYDRIAGELLGPQFRKLRKHQGLGDWRAGYCRRIELAGLRHALDDVMGLPAMPLVRTVEVEPAPPAPEPGWLTVALMPITYDHELRALRRLEVTFPGMITHRPLGRLRLRELSCALALGVDLEPCDALAGLQYLAFAPEEPRALSRAAELPALRDVVLGWTAACPLDPEALAPVLALPLGRLAIRNVPRAQVASLMTAIAGAPIAKSLRVLELTGAGPRVTVQHAALAHLEAIVVDAESASV